MKTEKQTCFISGVFYFVLDLGCHNCIFHPHTHYKSRLLACTSNGPQSSKQEVSFDPNCFSRCLNRMFYAVGLNDWQHIVSSVSLEFLTVHKLASMI